MIVTHIVRVVETETGIVVREINTCGQRVAESVERGILININAEQYHTEIVAKDNDD
jgi:hypothetical protein